jgi:hypothetical protein
MALERLTAFASHHLPTALAVTMMPQTSWVSIPAEHMKYRSIFVSALKAYEEKTGNVLFSDPLLRRFGKCRSLDDIITILRQQIPGIGTSPSGHRSLTRWLNHTVNVINSFSAAIDGTIGLVSHRGQGDTSATVTLMFISAGANTRRADIYGHWRPPFSKSLYNFPLNPLL